MHCWIGNIFRRLLAVVLAISIAGGVGFSSSTAHATQIGDRFDCRVESSQADRLRLRDTAFQKSADQKIKSSITSYISQSQSKKMSDSACCSAICSPSAMLVDLFLPAMRKDPQANWNVSLREPVPTGYDPLRRPPRTRSEID